MQQRRGAEFLETPEDKVAFFEACTRESEGDVADCTRDRTIV